MIGGAGGAAEAFAVVHRVVSLPSNRGQKGSKEEEEKNACGEKPTSQGIKVI